MKKLITLCIFTFSLFFVTNSFSQDKLAINGAASENAKTLATKAKLSKDQLELAYQAFKAYENSIVHATDANNTINPKRKEVIEFKLQEELSNILTQDQFEKFLEVFDKKLLIEQ